MESKTNITNIPLNAGAIFMGTYEDVSTYVSTVISILADTQAIITCYQSLNKQLTSTTTFTYTNVNNLQTFIISPLTLPYVYFVVRNSSSTNQTYLNFSVKYVSSPISSGGGFGSDVNITNTQIPVSQYGTWAIDSNITNTSLDVAVSNFPSSFVVSGTVDANITNSSIPVSGSVDANITNTSLDVAVSNFPASQVVSGTVSIDNFPASQDVNITNSSIPVTGSVNINNFPSSQDVNITNTSLNVAVSNFPIAPLSTNLAVQVMNESITVENIVFNSQLTQQQNIANNTSTTNTKLDTVITDLNKFTFDGTSNLNINLNNINSSFLDNNALRVQVENSSLAITNSTLSTMSFNSGSLNVYDNAIYNILNTRGTSQLYNGSISSNGLTNVLDLSNKKVNNLTFYGNQNSNGNQLIVLFSNNNTTFYKTQYSYQFTTGINGDFGFSIQSCPRYLVIQSVNSCNLTLYCDYC